MSLPFPSGSKRATEDVVVELSHNQVPPTLPLELRNHVSPNTWEVRVSTLTQLASRYCRPSLERAYLVAMLVLTFLVPIVTYYAALRALENTSNNLEQDVWFARFTSIATIVATFLVLSMPWVLWKHLGKVRVMKLANHWTKSDALAASTYGDAPVWRASLPSFFKDTIDLVVTIPVTKKSQFDPNSLPPYVSAGEDALPAYGDSSMTTWSKDIQGGVKYGDLPIYTNDHKLAVV